MLSSDDQILVDAGIELMKQNPTMSSGLASRKVCPGPENSKRRKSILNAIDYYFKGKSRVKEHLSTPSETRQATPWKPSNAPWTPEKPSPAFIRMLGDYSEQLGEWTQEYFDGVMKEVGGGTRYTRENQVDFAKPAESADGEDLSDTESIPYTGKKRNGANYLDVTEYFKRSDLGVLPRNLRLALLEVEADVMRGERKQLYVTWSSEQMKKDKAKPYGPFIDTSDQRESVGLNTTKGGHLYDDLPSDPEPTEDSE